jgi:hypothetical protein
MFRSEEVVLTDIVWDGESNVDFGWNMCTHWGGAKRKDFWGTGEVWEDKIKIGSHLRIWTAPNSSVVGFELEENGRWVPVWCIANDFRTKEKREADEDSYEKFILVEGIRISNMIDEGLSYTEISERVSKGHSGNTFGIAFSLGIRDAENRENAEVIRRAHNKFWGIDDYNMKGVVNPAILTGRCKDK